MTSKPTGAEIRQTFIDFFVEHKHTFVPSASLVPGGDATLLFTNAGMVQFKDVFLGTDKRPYTRAVDSQKVLRVAGKHNDLEQVGRDDIHHTFFEMLGNWSFGDYYKKEAIAWAWQLLTDVWDLPKDKLYATCFKDEQGLIPTDDEAAGYWKEQPGMDPEHVLFFGRKENFWEMAETGPCGPCSEIHIDRGEQFDNLRGLPHRCGVNGECNRYLELWNNVFIQYNRIDKDTLEPLPARHVDTGMGFERIVSVLQGVDSDYKIDLFQGALDAVRALTGDSTEKMLANFTPYRVIADHARAAAFLIADGVVPGNVGRNYICRMIIRRAARFGTKLGLHEPFLANVAEAIIAAYGDFYPELVKSREAILDNLKREEIRFAHTVELGTAYLQGMLDELKKSGSKVLDGRKVFDLYATSGLPLEIARDIAREQDLDVDEAGFQSGHGRAPSRLGRRQGHGPHGRRGCRILYRRCQGSPPGRSAWARMGWNTTPMIGCRWRVRCWCWWRIASCLARLMPATRWKCSCQKPASTLNPAGRSRIPAGFARSPRPTARGTGGSPQHGGEGGWEIEITGMRKPSPGAIVHVGEVVFGHPKPGDLAVAVVDAARRHDIRRNHTATHLLHAALHQVLGDNARQAGSLVGPDHFRFDFNHPEAMTPAQVEQVEKLVNEAVAADYPVTPVSKPRREAEAEGAMALFGEKYGEVVRTITIGDPAQKYSYELCGGTHLDRTSDVGAFLIVSESSAAAGVRRIEGVTGRGAYELVARRFKMLKQAAAALKSGLEEVPQKAELVRDELAAAKKEISILRQQLALAKSDKIFEKNAYQVNGITVVFADFSNTDRETLRFVADRFRQKYEDTGGTIIASGIQNDQPIVITASTDNVIEYGLDASQIAKIVAEPLGGSGGGRPILGQTGGKDISKLPEALEKAKKWIDEKLKTIK